MNSVERVHRPLWFLWHGSGLGFVSRKARCCDVPVVVKPDEKRACYGISPEEITLTAFLKACGYTAACIAPGNGTSVAPMTDPPTWPASICSTASSAPSATRRRLTLSRRIAPTKSLISTSWPPSRNKQKNSIWLGITAPFPTQGVARISNLLCDPFLSTGGFTHSQIR